MGELSQEVLWNAFRKSLKNTVIALMRHVREGTGAANVCIITGEMVNCPHVSSAKKMSELMTAPLQILYVYIKDNI